MPIERPSFRLHCVLLVTTLALLWVSPVVAQSNANKHALIIGGLGGSPDHTQKFKTYLFETKKALVETFQFDESHITVLGETSIASEPFVNAIANAENIRQEFSNLNASAGSADEVYIILFGHGGYDNGQARLNIPRRDLSQTDYAGLVDELNAGRVVFINTGSASAPFVEALSGDNRIVITATRTGTQKNETSFPRFMVEALKTLVADRDKDGRVSVGELFQYSAERTDQYFEDNGNLATENALIDDNGDQEGSRLDAFVAGNDGHLANITYLSAGPAIASATGNTSSGDAGWLSEKANLEVEIATLKSKKSDMDLDTYYAELEVLFVQLARGNLGR